jgi:hypothetical protein
MKPDLSSGGCNLDVAAAGKLFVFIRIALEYYRLHLRWQAFAAYIKGVGTAMVIDPERDRVLVQDLLQFKEKLDRVLSVAFHASEPFSHSLKEAFECFINVRQVCTSVFLHSVRLRYVLPRPSRGLCGV